MSGEQSGITLFTNRRVVELLENMSRELSFIPDFGATSGMEVLEEGLTAANLPQTLALAESYYAKAQSTPDGIVGNGVSVSAMWQSDLLPLLAPEGERSVAEKLLTIKGLLAFAASTELFAPFAIREAAERSASIGSHLEAAALYVYLLELPDATTEERSLLLQLAHNNYRASGLSTAAEAVALQLIGRSQTLRERHNNMMLLADFFEKAGFPERAASVRERIDSELAKTEKARLAVPGYALVKAKELIDAGNKEGALVIFEQAMSRLAEEKNHYSSAIMREAFALSYSMRFGIDKYYVEQLFLIATDYYIAAKTHLHKKDSVEFKMLTHEYVNALNFAFSQSIELELQKASTEVLLAMRANGDAAPNAEAKQNELVAARVINNLLGPDTEAATRLNDLVLPTDYFCERAASAIVMLYRTIAGLAGNNTELKIFAAERAMAMGMYIASEVSGQGGSGLAQKMVLTIYSDLAAQHGLFSRERSLLRDRVIDYYNNKTSGQNVSFGVKFAMFRLRFLSELIPNLESESRAGVAVTSLDGTVELFPAQRTASAKPVLTEGEKIAIDTTTSQSSLSEAVDSAKKVVGKAERGQGSDPKEREIRGKK